MFFGFENGQRREPNFFPKAERYKGSPSFFTGSTRGNIRGRAAAGLSTYSRGVFLGLFQPTPKEVKEQRRKMRKEETVTVHLLHLAVPEAFSFLVHQPLSCFLTY